MPVYPELKGQKVVVTGCGSGIGLAQAQAFLSQGAYVFGTDLQANANIQAILQTYPKSFYFYPADLTQGTQIKALAAKVLTTLDAVDILLNTAGILDDYTPSLDTSEQLWDKVFDTNVKSMFLLTNEFLPNMLAKKAGVIINMASIAGLVAGGGGAAYSAAKHAIIGYTKQLAYDYASCGIRANCIAPGAIDTPMNRADFLENDGQMAKEVASKTPVKRWAAASEVADLTLYLASPNASYIHGAVVPIDGGWIIQ